MDRNIEKEEIRKKILNEKGIINYDEWIKLCEKSEKIKGIISSIQEVCRGVRACMVSMRKIQAKIKRMETELEITKNQSDEAEIKIDHILESLLPIRQNSIEAKEIIIDPKKLKNINK